MPFFVGVGVYEYAPFSTSVSDVAHFEGSSHPKSSDFAMSCNEVKWSAMSRI